MKAVAVAVLIVALAACDRSIDEIEQQRTLWVANEPQTYAYTIQVSGWRVSRDLGHPKRVTVSNGSARAEYVWRSAEHAIGEPAGVGTYWSMAAVFDELVVAK